MAEEFNTQGMLDVYLFENGQIIEQGTHATLLAQKGFYYNLYQSQFSI